ncbi:hypothetical protein [Rhizobium leguminosarum]|uniref:hypothetical protein n=1 Tax=Rhizobium leguminosarum TaxID=384 RepID=UPI00103037C9|nr:hypothetical protein [Rhizobium leguminosarum]TBG92673.1 hypothetical protein ELG73_37935 [Rhizobium leguminosarum]
MNDLECYFRNRVTMMGKVVRFTEETSEYQAFLLETKEIWPEGQTLCESHEVRYYKNDRHPGLAPELVMGRLVEVNGRVRLKDNDAPEYRPFIHCVDFQLHQA